MEHVASLEQQAIDLARRGDFGTDARAVNEEITKLAPESQGAWTRLARCCLELGLLDEATAALDAALRLNPQNTIARNLQIEVSKRRAGPVPTAAPRRRASSTGRSSSARTAGTTPRTKSSTGRAGTIALGGFGRAEFSALGHLNAAAAVEALTARIEPLMMALNERAFAARVTEARNRAGHAGVRLFRRGSLQPGGPGHISLFHQGGRWEPQLHVGFFAAQPWGRDAIAAGIGFDLSEGDGDDRSEVGRERIFEYFAGFQQLISSMWRVHLTDWLRAGGGFVQMGHQPPATDLLPGDAISTLINVQNPGEVGWIFCGRWLFADRGEDVAIQTDAPRLIRWMEQTFTDLLPLWGEIYRWSYKSG